MELGLRHDWGDAETGFGVELGGRVQYADPGLGLTVDAQVRGLLALFDTGVVTPYAGTMLAAGADRTYRLGTRVQVPGRGAPGLTLNVEGTRQEPAGSQPLNQGLRFELSWGF